MTRKSRTWLALAMVTGWSASACKSSPGGVSVSADTESGSTSMAMDTSSARGESSTTGPAPVFTSGMGEGSASSGCGAFVCTPDGGGSIAPECDVWTQDCDPGEKCSAWDSSGAGAWDSTKCVPVNSSPKQAGEPCFAEGGGASGIDDCDKGLMCWEVDEMGMGTCVSLCMGNAQSPTCMDDATTCVIANDGVLNLCLASCDPLLQECPERQACYPIDEAFACAPDASGDLGMYADQCAFINVCDSGLFCANADQVPGCTGEGCCTPFCDLADPDASSKCPGASGGQECIAWYDPMMVPPGFESVGGCGIPQ